MHKQINDLVRNCILLTFRLIVQSSYCTKCLLAYCRVLIPDLLRKLVANCVHDLLLFFRLLLHSRLIAPMVCDLLHDHKELTYCIKQLVTNCVDDSLLKARLLMPYRLIAIFCLLDDLVRNTTYHCSTH